MVEVREENRFTRFCKSKSARDFHLLQRWLDWFTARGVEAVIGHSISGYAVYRNNLIPIPPLGEDRD